MENWSHSTSRKTPQVDLLVPPGQLAIGDALIKAMYEKQPDLSALSPQQQLQLLQLADAYDVEKVSLAACSSLSNLVKDSIDMPTAIAICDSPESCRQLKHYGALQEAAANKIQQEFGDLEVVWGGGDDDMQQQQKQQLLIGMSFAALCQLLADSRTRVTSEDTVYYTVARWLEQHSDTPLEQQKQLAELIRLPQCTPTYLSSIICSENSWIRSCISNKDLFRACAFCSTSSSSNRGKLMDTAAYKPHVPIIKRHPSWASPCRPASAVTQLDFTMTVPLAKLQASLEESVSQNVNATVEASLGTWQGRCVCCKLVWACRSDGTSSLGCMLSGRGGAMRSCIAKDFCVHYTIQGHKSNGEAVTLKTSRTTVVNGVGRRLCDVLKMGRAHNSWEPLEQQLRDKGWVDADGCVHVSGTVHELA